MRSLLLLGLACLPGIGHDTPGTLRGRVSDSLGAPVAAAEVTILEQIDPALQATGTAAREPERFTARSDAAGLFRIEVPDGRLYRVWATDGAGDRVSSVRSAVRPGEPLRLSLLRAASVRLLADEARPGPLAWHLLTVDRERHEEFVLLHGIARTPPITLPPLPPGRYRLRVRSRDGWAGQSELQLGPAATVDVRPRLVRPATIRLAATRDVAAGAQVRLPFPLGFPGDEWMAGGAEIAVPALDLVLALRIRLADETEIETNVGPLRPGEHAVVTLPELARRTIGLHLPPTTPESELVLLWSENGGVRQRSFQAPPAELVVRGMPATDVLALHFDGRGNRSAVRIAADATDLRFAPTEAAAAEFLVLGEDGFPQLQARLVLFPSHLPEAPGLAALFPTLLRFPDRRGTFRIAALPPGDYEVRVEAPFHVPDQVRLPLRAGEQRNYTFRLERGYRLHGLVLGPGGDPAASVLVTMTYPLAANRTQPLETLTDDDGRFQFAGIPDGTFVVEARRSVGSRSYLARQRAEPGPEPVHLRLADEDPRVGR